MIMPCSSIKILLVFSYMFSVYSFSITSGAYTYTKYQSCTPISPPYSSLASAKRACNADSSCQAVVDWACEDHLDGTFHLCSLETDFVRSSYSCTYEKGHLWNKTASNKYCFSYVLERSTNTLAGCQALCEAKRESECVGISYSHKIGRSDYCYLCEDDKLSSVDSEYVFYRRPERTYIMADLGKDCDDMGQAYLISEEDCKEAAIQLSMTFFTSLDDSSLVKGCLANTDSLPARYLGFNKNANGGSIRPNDRSICLAIPELPRNMSAARGPKPTLGFTTTIAPRPKWKPNLTAKWPLNIDTTKEPKAEAKPKANRTHMGKTNTNPNINWKPKPKWDCLDCGFAMEVCCKYYNGSASCQKLSDCQTDSQSLSYTPLRKVDRYHASLRHRCIDVDCSIPNERRWCPRHCKTGKHNGFNNGGSGSSFGGDDDANGNGESVPDNDENGAYFGGDDHDNQGKEGYFGGNDGGQGGSFGKFIRGTGGYFESNNGGSGKGFGEDYEEGSAFGGEDEDDETTIRSFKISAGTYKWVFVFSVSVTACGLFVLFLTLLHIYQRRDRKKVQISTVQATIASLANTYALNKSSSYKKMEMSLSDPMMPGNSPVDDQAYAGAKYI